MIEVDVSNLYEVAEELNRLGLAVKVDIPIKMREAVVIVERDAKERAPVDTGRLRASITSEVTGMMMDTVGIVGSNVEYAPFVEMGTKPHFPPWRPGTSLARWAELHGMSAFVVALVISWRGTKARKFLQGAFEAKRDEIIKLFINWIKGIRW
jgi:HK97 gp10 family phage protein